MQAVRRDVGASGAQARALPAMYESAVESPLPTSARRHEMIRYAAAGLLAAMMAVQYLNETVRKPIHLQTVPPYLARAH